MAGAGYKLFATGDVLTAAQVNTYLMQQTVMVFASSAARTSALSGVLAEGMVSYLQDTNTLEVYDGSAWIGATGDITALTAGTGISITNPTGPVPTVAIDTAVTADLTTGQTLTNKTLTSPVLTTPSISNINAKGDILVGTADNTLGVITAGSNGEILLADSSTSTGLRYQGSQAAGKNVVINGAFNVWQRGTSISVLASTTPYTADRWQVYTNANQATTVSRQATGDTTNLPFIQYAMRYQRNSGQTGIVTQSAAQTLDSATSIPFAGKTISLSFYARAGANYSPASSALIPRIQTGTGSDQNFYTGFTGSILTSLTAATLTTTWQRFTYSHAVPASATQIGVDFTMTPVGTAGAADYFEITGVQMEVGSTATPFQTASGSIGGELALCQRYYTRYTTGAASGNAIATSTTAFEGNVTLLVAMRITPATLDSSATRISDGVTNTNTATLLLNAGNSSPTNAYLTGTVASGLTAFRPYFLSTNAGYYGFSAEL